MKPELSEVDILRRFNLITGKGGVGKSTVTAALALMSAQRGERTLVCELNTHEQVSRLLGYGPVGSTVTPLEENLWSVNINPNAALQEYGLMKLRFHAFYRLVFENPLVGALVRFIPGINDLLMLGKAFNHEREETEHGLPVWDRIIIDAPATGHSLTFFRLPKIIMDAVPAGNMHTESAEMWKLLSDPARCAIHIVALPEELPIQETSDLHDKLTNELQLPVSTIFLNQVPDLPVPKERVECLDSWTIAPKDRALRELWSAGRVRLELVKQSTRHRETLTKLGRPIITMPIRYESPFGRADIEAMVSTIQDACHAG
jgi:anion-transporting  ArsA/GET3 family ATPase